MLKKCWRCGLSAYRAAITRPREHKALLIGNALTLVALVFGMFGHPVPEHVTGAGGIALVIHHILISEV